MKVAILSPSLSRKIGGVFEVERELARAIDRRDDTQVVAYGLQDTDTIDDLPAWEPVAVRYAHALGPKQFGFSPALRRLVMQSDADIVHLHSLWLHTSVIARDWARNTGRPVITSTHGMLEPWAIANSAWKKWLALHVFERNALREAACLHVNTEAELQSVRNLGITGPVCVLPNGVTLPASAGFTALPVHSSLQTAQRAGARILLYLGRLHPKKNLDATLVAFAETASPWHLAVVGWGEPDYRETLVAKARTLGILDRVHFLGPAFGDEKTAFLRAADAFVLASHSEGFPMAVLEAMAFAKPVLMSGMCNFPEGFHAGAAIETGTDAGSIAAAMIRLTSMSDSERHAMGARGRELVERDYRWDAIGDRLFEVYRWLVAGGTPPSSVRL